ncbi:hypothetical protein GX50_06425 [[Emmonsia] crescens]|uniref:Uncharacterized protein n=1 Tax=[Emmonsia] crescens TaxID=73230 RepID=A0A2B7ZD93_9EURO|nr:hypothetical protein GX50_06425 [Emmonsia crescens]
MQIQRLSRSCQRIIKAFGTRDHDARSSNIIAKSSSTTFKDKSSFLDLRPYLCEQGGHKLRSNEIQQNDSYVQ